MMDGYGDYHQHLSSRSAFTELSHQPMPYHHATTGPGATAPYARPMHYGAAAAAAHAGRRAMTNSNGPDGHPSLASMGPMGQTRHFGYFMNSPIAGPPIYDPPDQISSLPSKEGNPVIFIAQFVFHLSYKKMQLNTEPCLT